MDAPFPFGYPFPTAFYLTWYVLTLILHVVFMNYVLAGSAYLATVALFAAGDPARSEHNPVSRCLRDWMPFMLSAAITAGVAPLLFLQVLYRKQFYTANLLLFHRWMAIVPVLITGFYLLYLLKSKAIGGWPIWLRLLVGCGAFACFAFTAWSWTENHLLSLDAAAWPDHYAASRLVYPSPELFPRLALWFVGAFPTMATIVAWPLRGAHLRNPEHEPAGSRRLTVIALSGLGASIVAGLVYYSLLGAEVRHLVTGRFGGVYCLLACAGVGLQVIAWSALWIRRTLSGGWLTSASAGLLLSIAGVTVLREARRVAAIELPVLFPAHAAASEVGGLVTFVAFFALNALLIAACFVLVRRGLKAGGTKSPGDGNTVGEKFRSGQ